MNSARFTNTHMHVFNAQCVPGNFLRVIPKRFLRRIAPQLLKLIDTAMGRWIIKNMAKQGSRKNPAQRTMTDKYVSFLNVGLQNTQRAVFEMERDTVKSVDANFRMLVLTMNMDYMDESLPPMGFNTQIEDVKGIKRYYPEECYAMYGVDPRHLSGESGLQLLRTQMETGTNYNGVYYPYFVGLKLYPALGYFPFDSRLLQIYAYAEKNLLPVMTHCTRVGSQYIGRSISSLIPKNIGMVYPINVPLTGADADTDLAARTSIQNRIDKYYKKEWIKDNKLGENDDACDLFGHPENYVPLLLRFPNLKICLAHMGGSYEIDTTHDNARMKEVRNEADPIPWFDRISAMMQQYPNLYTDVSYTLSSFDPTGESKDVVIRRTLALMKQVDKNGVELAYRVLFGTDFFMTEQEMRESELIMLAKNQLAGQHTSKGEDYWELMTKTNPQRYLNV